MSTPEIEASEAERPPDRDLVPFESPSEALDESTPEPNEPHGFPLGNILLFVFAGLGLAAAGLYAAAGTTGLLVAGGTVVGSGLAVAAWRARRSRNGRTRTSRWSPGRTGRGTGTRRIGGRLLAGGRSGRLAGGSRSGGLLGRGSKAKSLGGAKGRLFGAGKGRGLSGGKGRGLSGGKGRLFAGGKGRGLSGGKGKALGGRGGKGRLLGGGKGRLLGGRSGGKSGRLLGGRNAASKGRGGGLFGRLTRRSGRASGGKSGRAIGAGGKSTRSRAPRTTGAFRRLGRVVRNRKAPRHRRVFAGLGLLMLALIAPFTWLGEVALKRYRAARETANQDTESETPPDSTKPDEAKPDAPRPERDHYEYNRRKRTVSGFPLAAAAAEMTAAAASHAPDNAFQIATELDQFDEIPAHVAMAVRTYTARLQGGYPVHESVIDALFTYFEAQSKLIAMAEQIGSLFRKVHAKDLQREEAPRTGEQHWDVGRI